MSLHPGVMSAVKQVNDRSRQPGFKSALPHVRDGLGIMLLIHWACELPFLSWLAIGHPGVIEVVQKGHVSRGSGHVRQEVNQNRTSDSPAVRSGPIKRGRSLIDQGVMTCQLKGLVRWLGVSWSQPQVSERSGGSGVRLSV